MWRAGLAALVFAFLVWQAWPASPIRHPPGLIAPRAPAQLALDDAAGFVHGELRVRRLARFDVEARVLGRERYWLAREATLAPIDLALGWGPMSDQTVLDRITITQSGRWYHWRTVGPPPIPVPVIVEHSANMHLAPATPEVWRTIRDVRVGDVVRLEGALIEATAGDGWRWRSSLVRTDTGPGACELVWVERAVVRPRLAPCRRRRRAPPPRRRRCRRGAPAPTRSPSSLPRSG